jgi:hypothetical protein
MTSSQNILALIHEVAILFPVFLILFSFRGFFMAWAAGLMGSKTPHKQGFFSLNPFKQCDVIKLGLFLGTLMGVTYFVDNLVGNRTPQILLFLMLLSLRKLWVFEVPVKEKYFRHPRAYSILYGFIPSISFLILASTGLVCIKILGIATLPHYAFISIAQCLDSLVNATLFFGIVNFIPLPPFEAARILYPILPDKYHSFIDKVFTYDFIVIGAILLIPGADDTFMAFVTKLQIMFKAALVSILF